MPRDVNDPAVKQLIKFMTALVETEENNISDREDKIYATDPEILAIASIFPHCNPFTVGRALTLGEPPNLSEMLSAFRAFDGLYVRSECYDWYDWYERLTDLRPMCTAEGEDNLGRVLERIDHIRYLSCGTMRCDYYGGAERCRECRKPKTSAKSGNN